MKDKPLTLILHDSVSDALPSHSAELSSIAPVMQILVLVRLPGPQEALQVSQRRHGDQKGQI